MAMKSTAETFELSTPLPKEIVTAEIITTALVARNHPPKFFLLDNSTTTPQLIPFKKPLLALDVPLLAFESSAVKTVQAEGFGYVEFNSTEEAQEAIKYNGYEIDGRSVKLDFAEDRPKREGGGFGGDRRGGRGGFGGDRRGGRGGFGGGGGFRGGDRGGRGGFGGGRGRGGGGFGGGRGDRGGRGGFGGRGGGGFRGGRGDSGFSGKKTTFN